MKNSKKNKISIFSLTLIGITILICAVFLIKSGQLTDKNSVNVYFVKSFNGADFQLAAVNRKISHTDSKISAAITELLKGPSRKEKRAGFYTEIPAATRLLEIKESSKSVIINLSKDFESGGGSTSMIMRLKQLVNTALDSVKKKPVYLELNGKKVDFIGGEGVIVPQPLSRKI